VTDRNEATMTPPPLPPIALQLYTLRRLGLPFETLVRRAAEAGYAGVETVGSHGLDAAAAGAAAAAAGVKVCSSHVPLHALEEDATGVCRFNRALGNDVVVVPWLPPELRGGSAAGWQALGRRLAGLGQRCRDEGVRLLYHNHDFELEPVDGRTGLAWMLDAAAPEDLGLEPDLGWVRRAGLDPVALLAPYAGRCPRVHVKDLAPADGREVDGGWMDVGDGVLDWPALLPACRRAGAEWFVVEHDEPSDPIRTARRSAEQLRALL